MTVLDWAGSVSDWGEVPEGMRPLSLLRDLPRDTIQATPSEPNRKLS